ncbi:ABC transporter permease subunit [Streptomyces sp. A7024]|uniref:ABC transporter permease subunit n=1 Tax=Streptomyces coryli TaxID=1128680 RepID=A0A6G4U3E1_9ACTN|nr:ABC transporter permease subunit [Streptomyces coryli]NGN66522.1 ABC transporter permease subunit [Streptomyces coryli]
MTGRAALRGLFGTLAAVAAAEVTVRAAGGFSGDLPAPTQVLAAAGEQLADGEFTDAVGATLRVWAYGMLIAVGVAVPAGFLLSSIRALGTACQAIVEFLRPIPSVALIPLALLVFPAPDRMKTSLVVYASVWPILLNTLYALRQVDRVQLDTLKVFGFGAAARAWFVSLPSSVPFILTGVRVSASVALIVAISTELLAVGDTGIGTYLAQTQSAGGQTDQMLAGALWAGVIGLLINGALTTAERRAARWWPVSGKEGVA